jgi:cysteine desulfurase
MFNIFGGAKKRIYMDYAAATPVVEEARRAMDAAGALFANPGALHKEGVAAAGSLRDSRTKIASILGCRAHELIFTSGATEANNLAILGYFKHAVLAGARPAETHWVTSAIEHPSVLACFEHIEAMGGRVSYVGSDGDGRVSAERVYEALTPETRMVSVGWANSEIGVIQPLARIARTLREHKGSHKIVFHSDAGQAPLYLGTLITGLGVDLLSLDSGKIYGPRGIGALYRADDVPLQPVILGGLQERGLRAGSGPTALAAGFAAAFEIVARERFAESVRLRKLRDQFMELLSKAPGAVLNGSSRQRLPHILNVSFPDMDSEYLMLALDHAGVACSTKSACREGEEMHSHVVEALAANVPSDAWRARHTIRFSLGRSTTLVDVEEAARLCLRLLEDAPGKLSSRG